jgi:hypothetical protein
LEVAAVLDLRAVVIARAVAEAVVLHAGAAGSSHALLGVGARCVEARQEALAVDADPAISAVEVELAAHGRRCRLWLRLRRGGRRLTHRGLVLERADAKLVGVAARAERTVEILSAWRDASDVGADLADGAVVLFEAHVAWGRRLGKAFVVTTEKTPAFAGRAVVHTEVAVVVDAASDRAKGE